MRELLEKLERLNEVKKYKTSGKGDWAVSVELPGSPNTVITKMFGTEEKAKGEAKKLSMKHPEGNVVVKHKGIESYRFAKGKMRRAGPLSQTKWEDVELEEAKSAFDKGILKIIRQVDQNDHGGAILTAAKLLGAKSVEKRIKLVMELHDLEGSMPYPLIEYRNSLQKELHTIAKNKLEGDQWTKFDTAF